MVLSAVERQPGIFVLLLLHSSHKCLASLFLCREAWAAWDTDIKNEARMKIDQDCTCNTCRKTRVTYQQASSRLVKPRVSPSFCDLPLHIRICIFLSISQPPSSILYLLSPGFYTESFKSTNLSTDQWAAGEASSAASTSLRFVCLTVKRGGFQPTQHSPELSASTVPHQLTTPHSPPPRFSCVRLHLHRVVPLEVKCTFFLHLKLILYFERGNARLSGKASSAKGSEHLWLMSDPAERFIMDVSYIYVSKEKANFVELILNGAHRSNLHCNKVINRDLNASCACCCVRLRTRQMSINATIQVGVKSYNTFPGISNEKEDVLWGKKSAHLQLEDETEIAVMSSEGHQKGAADRCHSKVQ